MASDFVRKVKGIRNIDILSPNITTENDLISTIDGDVYVATNKGYRSITDGEKGEKGDINSLKVYNKPLTDSEIQHNYNLEKERWGYNMKFVIADLDFFKNLGYNTKYWRKNKDGSKTICHLEYAEILTHDLDKNENVQIVDAPEASEIMATDEWSWEEEI